MARRSDQVAVWLESLGVRRGDHVLLMLGNQVELWETMLAASLGAVRMPTTAAPAPSTCATGSTAAAARWWPMPPTRRSSRRCPATTCGSRWWRRRLARLRRCVCRVDGRSRPSPHRRTRCCTTHLRHHLEPKLVEHTQVSYPVGHLTTMYWIGLRPGDVHLAISYRAGPSTPGRASSRRGSRATVFVYNYARFDAAALLEQIRRAGVTTFCAPPTVWRMLIQADLAGGPGSLRELLGAGEPLNPRSSPRWSRPGA